MERAASSSEAATDIADEGLVKDGEPKLLPGSAMTFSRLEPIFLEALLQSGRLAPQTLKLGGREFLRRHGNEGLQMLFVH